MANQGNARGQAPARENSYGEDDIDFETPVNEGGLQGDGGEGGDLSGSATDDLGDEQDIGFEDGEGQQDDEIVAPRQQPRAQNRIQNLSRENAELRRQLAQSRGGAPSAPAAPPPQPSLANFGLNETDEQFNARIRDLSWEERMDAKQERSEKRAEARAQLNQFMSAQALDKTNWDATCKTDDLRNEWTFEVEKFRNDRIREQGQYIDREIIFTHLYGKFMASPEGRKGRQTRREQARRRVESQTVRPSSPRSDAGAGQDRRKPSSEAEARRRRLEGVQI
jgi:hypothetical protein